MEDTASLLIEEIRSLRRRVEVLEAIVLVKPQNEVSPPTPVKPHSTVSPKLQSFSVNDLQNVYFHFTPGKFSAMESVLSELIQRLGKRTSTRKLNIYAEFVHGRPDLSVDGRQFDGYTILLFIVVPGVTTVDDRMYKDANFDAQVVITLSGSFKRVDFGRSKEEVERLKQFL